MQVKFLFFSVRIIENVGKIEIALKKKEKTCWKSLGHFLEAHNSFIPKKDRGIYCYFEACI